MSQEFPIAKLCSIRSFFPKSHLLFIFCWLPIIFLSLPAHAILIPAHLRVEWRTNPLAVESPVPRLSWEVESRDRGEKQTACEICVASSPEKLSQSAGDLWMSGRISIEDTVGLPYAGKPLVSGQKAFWKVRVWDKNELPSAWSEPGFWSACLQPEDWRAQWIAFKDTAPLNTERKELYLPPAHYYRKEFRLKKPVKNAVVYGTALGLFELNINGQAVSDNYFEPGWSDYRQRACYRAHDVTALLQKGTNAIGAIVTDGWYAGYVGFGLLAGYGPNKTGRNFYGKTPALLLQMEIEYTDGSRDAVVTDPTWKVSDQGPVREADFLMGESYDARKEMPNWSLPGFDAFSWPLAIRAEENAGLRAIFSDSSGDREVELGFQRPLKLQAYPAPPVRVTQELKPLKITEPASGVYIYDLGQNFAGVIRLKVKGPAGEKIKIRYAEKLHPDGTLMTENLRRARATDFYTLHGNGPAETWSPHFTYHGFQYVELTGLSSKPDLETVVGLVLQSDTPACGTFECSDEVMTQFATNAQWTQRANFIEIPTDCPQRDERLGWMGDAQTYIRTATFNADVAAFFTKWLDDVEEAQRDFGAYPDYCPYPMSGGAANKTFGTAWTDAGVICPWTIWKVYGDTRIIERHWNSLNKFMDWRAASTTPEGLGTSIGNPWGDWLSLGETTPIEYIDTCYHALDCKLMAEMAAATGHKLDATKYRNRFEMVKAAFNKAYIKPDGTLKETTQTATALALWVGLLPLDLAMKNSQLLADKIARNGNHIATGFLGTRALLPALSAYGQNDLAISLFQSRQFPSWGYEVINGANSVWERWDSYTHEHGFEGKDGRQNAAMNSFNHYALGAVMEWAYRSLAGIDTDGAGYRHILIQPAPPLVDRSPYTQPINWVNAEYASVRGKIKSSWKMEDEHFNLKVVIPANTTALVSFPARDRNSIKESGQPAESAVGVKFVRLQNDRAFFEVESGSYEFNSSMPAVP